MMVSTSAALMAMQPTVEQPRNDRSKRRLGRRVSAAAWLVALPLVGCGDGVGPPKVTTIVVTSDIDTIIAVERSAQLTAVAKTESGDSVSAQFAWSSSNPTVATVNTTGLVQGVNAGSSTITAEADGKAGSLALRVVAADFNAIRAVLNDPLRPHLTSRLSTRRSSVESALTTADAAVASGNIAVLNHSLTLVATEASAATVADDRALLSTLVLLTNFAIRLVHL